MTARKKKVVPNNYVYLILDESESMRSIRDQVIRATNEIISMVRKRGAARGQVTHVCFQTFNSVVNKPLLFCAPIDALREITAADYSPHDMTALFDTIGQAVTRLEEIEFGKDDSVVFFIITDGDNNQYHKFNEFDIRRLIAKHAENYTFGFQVPPGRADLLVKKFGIPIANVSEWETTTEGTQKMSEGTQAAVGNYYDDRAAGQRTSRRLFAKVQTKVVPKGAIKRSLDNLAGEFKQYIVARESAIREFVESKTGTDYVIGSAFYQLVKPETVQPTKEVVLQEKVGPGVRKAGAIYGGTEARELIGLPPGQYAKVTPGNHGDFDVYVQSKSINRILPRGTKVLVRA